MNDCKSIMDRMLEAPLSELDPGSDGPFADHLRRCASCASAAREIVAATRALRTMRAAEIAADPDLDAILARAGLATGTGSAPAARHRNGTRAWLGLAAAAVIATVLLRPSPPLPLGESVSRPSPSPPPLVEAAGGQDVVVLPTRNPDITVVWLYDSQE